MTLSVRHVNDGEMAEAVLREAGFTDSARWFFRDIKQRTMQRQVFGTVPVIMALVSAALRGQGRGVYH